MSKAESDFSGTIANSNGPNQLEIDKSKTGNTDLTIVGIGSSAGGLEPLDVFFRHMPSDSGLAFVIVSHLDPTRPSLLAELIQATTSMTVCEVTGESKVQPNHIYVIAPGSDLVIANGVLRAGPGSSGSNMPIDVFFQSLAENSAGNAIAIVLSGSGSDGTAGIRAIKSRLGMVMVQDPETAKYSSMPRSAVATGLTDFTLAPEAMPAKLMQYVTRPPNGDRPEETGSVPIAALKMIFVLLQSRTGHDFSLYKYNTIIRRIERRMDIHQLDSIEQYVRYLRESEHEGEKLFNELLIGVTSFFRGDEVFEYLETVAIPELLVSKTLDFHLRVWVAGCSTGEEAYSIAILLHECMERTERYFSVQVFGTDISKTAIDIARAGVFPKSIASDVSPARLERYFTETDDGQFRIKAIIREMLVFAPQDVIKDPPFTNLDLLCCRNLLIYFRPELQRQLLPVFHYSINDGGLLLLGSSESIGQHLDLFKPIESKHKIFSKNKTIRHGESPKMPAHPSLRKTIALEELHQVATPDPPELRYVEAILGKSEAPPCVIINKEHDIVYVHGRTGLFLEHADGKISVNVLDTARPGIRSELSSALRQLSKKKEDIVRPNVLVSVNGKRVQLNLTLRPLSQPGMTLVIFEEVLSADDSNPQEPFETLGKTREEVELELRDTRESLRSIVEEMQASNEEQKSTNEELQSTNEELQSTNEELETSKEELQSLNEESVTVNNELQFRIDELSKTSDDLKNLLDSTEIATLFLDGKLLIRSYTPRATDLIPLQVSDKGRPISELAANFVGDINLRNFASQVLDDLVIREMEVISKDNSVYLLRARPYRTLTNVIDGVVLTFENVTKLKAAEQTLLNQSEARGKAKFESLLQSCVHGAVISRPDGTIRAVNRHFCEYIGYTETELMEMKTQDLTHPDSMKETERQLGRGVVSDPATVPNPTSFKQSHCHKNGTKVSASVTVTWHREELPAGKSMYSIAFISPLPE